MKTTQLILALLGVASAETAIEAKWAAVQKSIESEAQLVGEDKPKTIEELATANGFKIESHQVHTEDGYILGVWRIPGMIKHEKNGSESTQRVPVLMQHGIESDMMQWVYNKADTAPAFVLARAGYDVWLGNNRGNRFSQTHETLSSKKKEFWHFTWEEQGTKDTPATIDYILKQTGAAKVNYVGHSQGTTSLMAGASLQPEYFTSKINHAALLAPVTTFRGTTNDKMHFWAKYGTGTLQTLLELAGQFDLIPFADKGICNILDGKICDTFESIFLNTDVSIDDSQATLNMKANMPAGSGYRNWIHYWQSIPLDAEKFQRFDYGGPQANIDRYGLAYAPQYELKNLKFPVSIFSGSADGIATPVDTKWTTAQFSDQIVFQKEYNLSHMSFVTASDMSYFTKDVMAVLNHANGVCDKNTSDSSFEIGNDACMEAASFLQ